MRAFLLAGFIFASLAAGDDIGVSPKPKPSDYPVHDSVKTAMIGAAIVPPEQVKKMFSPETSKEYVVVEVAVYPEGGRSFDVDLFAFALKAGDQVVRPSEPRDVAIPWRQRSVPLASRGPNVTTDTGIIVARETDPNTGRPRTSVGTYQGVEVSNYPTNPAPPPPSNPGLGGLVDKICSLALPQGPTGVPVAGYLYFRHHTRKQDSFTLNYADDQLSVDLRFPK
jgi:hypothetical protein